MSKCWWCIHDEPTWTGMLYYVPFNNSKVLNCREATMLLLISTQVMENSVIPSNITAKQTSTLTSLLPLYSLLISFTLNQSTLFSSHQHIAAHFSVHFRNVKTIRSQTEERQSSDSLLFFWFFLHSTTTHPHSDTNI